MVYLVLGFPLVLLAILGVAKFRDGRARQPAGGAVLHLNCPRCRRRLGYRDFQVGRRGACPRCLYQLIFPPGSSARAAAFR